MQDEQQQSVADILSSIRHVLSREAETLKKEVPDKPVRQAVHPDTVFELTPQMRVEKDALVTPQTVMKTQAALNQLNSAVKGASDMPTQQVERELRPLLQEWLNTHLPDMVERIVTQEVRRIINRG